MKPSLKLTGEERTARHLRDTGDKALDLRPALRRVGVEFARGEERLFQSQKGWPPLALSTRARKRRQGLPLRAMRATGLLERTLTSKTAMPGRLMRVNRSSITFGIAGGRSPIYYGRFHNEGKGNPKRSLVVGDDQLVRTRAMGVLRDHVLG